MSVVCFIVLSKGVKLPDSQNHSYFGYKHIFYEETGPVFQDNRVPTQHAWNVLMTSTFRAIQRTVTCE